jgi:phosphoglycerate dehydrogenase-like enzyme
VTRRILVYHPEPGEARAYADLIRLPSRDLAVSVALTPAEAVAAAPEAEILYCWRPPPALLPAAKRLRWIQCMGAGVEQLLVPELGPRVAITRAAGIFGPWMAEYALGWCLWVTQRMDGFRASQRARRWAPVDPIPLRGQTLCVVGLGDIGRRIARTGRALGLRVIGVSRRGRGARDVGRVYPTRALATALAQADFVVLALPLSAATRGMIDAPALAAMKPSAWLINVARGPIVDEAALIAALRARRVGGAILDVFDTEPLPPEHPLWGLDNVVITPHISGPSTPREIAPIFADNLRRYLAGRPLRHAVDRRRGY